MLKHSCTVVCFNLLDFKCLIIISPTEGEGDIVFGVDPVGVSVGVSVGISLSCLHDIS